MWNLISIYYFSWHWQLTYINMYLCQISHACYICNLDFIVFSLHCAIFLFVFSFFFYFFFLNEFFVSDHEIIQSCWDINYNYEKVVVPAMSVVWSRHIREFDWHFRTRTVYGCGSAFVTLNHVLRDSNMTGDHHKLFFLPWIQIIASNYN